MTDSKKTRTVREIDCDEVMRQLFDFLDGEVAEEVDHEIHHHIEECRSCFTRVEFERALKERIRASKDEALPESLQDRVKDMLRQFGTANIAGPGKDGE